MSGLLASDDERVPSRRRRSPATRGEFDELSKASRRKKRVSPITSRLIAMPTHHLVGAEAQRHERVEQRAARAPPPTPQSSPIHGLPL